MRSSLLRLSLPALLASVATAQAPEIIHYTFDAGDATNSAVPGVGNGTPSAGLGFVPGGICAGAGDGAVTSINTTCEINSGWMVDLGQGDWTVGMQLDLRVTASTTLQYYFGSSTTGGFRCFNGGVAGTDGLMLRTLQNDALINGLPATAAPFHVCWVYDSSVPEVRGYIDGVQTHTFPQAAPINLMGTAADFKVMDYTIAPQPGAIMDDFRFYRRAITGAEVLDWAMNCGGGGGLGSSYCGPAVPNSTGVGATITATGSVDVASNDLTLVASSLPQNAFGFFLTSMTQGTTPQPGGSQGVLCLGGNIGRYVGPGQIQNSGTTGEIMLALDLTQHPTPTGLVSVAAGETWNFQAWFRDASGGIATSNFTDGLQVDFL